MNMTAMRTIFIVTISLLFSLNVKAEKVTCPPGLSWTFEGQCMRPLDSKGSSCPPGTTLAKLHATGPLVCKGRWKCLSDINKVPNANGICVDPEEVKPIPRQYTQKMIHTTPKPEPPKTE
jgi:hypothetical protein